MNFVAIDFETANNRRSSACSVAVVEVRQGKIYDSFYSLIRPPQLDFNYTNIKIHGITPADVREKPKLPELWPSLRSHLEDKIVIAHNASFDMGVLKDCLDEYHLPGASFQHCCSVGIARRVWPDLPNHKLGTLGDYFHIDFQHHNALDDARTCAAVVLMAAKECGAKTLCELLNKIKMPLKAFAGQVGQ